MSGLPLDSRQARIARQLLADTTPRSVEAIAARLGMTARMVRYSLPAIESYFRDEGVHIARRRGLGVWLTGAEDRREALQAGLDGAEGVRVLDARDRKLRALGALLERAPQPVSLRELEVEIDASRPTVRRDVRATEPWLQDHHLHLQRLPGTGVAVRGSESDLRKALLALVLEALSTEELLARVDGGPHAPDNGADANRPWHLASGLDLPTYRSILSSQLRELDDGGPMSLVATVYLAILAHRVAGGHRAEYQSGQLRSLIDHPVADAGARIAAAVERATGLSLGESDVAAITEFLLGFVELSRGGVPEASDDVALVDRLVEAAADRLHPSLRDDDQLRRSLGEHVRRLRVRLRYGLPVTNPLDQEVRERYPDVYQAASGIVRTLESDDGSPIPPDEVGFLAMYLAGSLERNRLRPKVRVTVVCPAGMATAWILVSRLMAVFPQVEIIRVISKAAFEGRPEDVGSDVVISTVPLDDDPDLPPLVVVGPLLKERDIRRLSRLLGEPTH